MHILIVRPGALGDVILTLPLVQALHSQCTEATIEMMGNAAVLRLLCGRTAVHAVWSFDGLDVGPMFQPDAVLTGDLSRRFGGYDLIINYAGPADSVFAHNLSRVARGRLLHCDARPGAHISMHMSEFLQRPLHSLGVPPCTDPPRLELTEQDRQQASSWWAERRLTGKPAVALHPGSGSPAKNWPAERFAAVARHLVAAGNQVLPISGPADAIPALAVQQQMQGRPLTPVADLPLPVVAAILRRCAGYVGNDSGISHLAAAVGIPVVAIFGPTDANVWAPRGRAVTVLRGSVSAGRANCEPLIDLRAVSVETVIQALRAVAGL